MKTIKKSLFFVFLATIIHFFPVAMAVNIPVIEEIDVPANLDFEVHSIQGEYAYFMQATARTDGAFAVYGRHWGADGNVDLEVVYIDLYDKDGNFLQELTFRTPFNIAVELTDTSVNIYFYASLLCYDLETQSLHNYSIPENFAENEGIYERLRAAEFSAGNWKYICKKSFDGYTALTRSNEQQTQTLVQMEGTGNSFWNVFFPGLAIGTLGTIILVRSQKKKKTKI